VLNSKEAIYGFCGWLTSRSKKTTMSSKDDCGCIPDLIEKFCEINHLPEITDDWPDNLIHPPILGENNANDY